MKEWMLISNVTPLISGWNYLIAHHSRRWSTERDRAEILLRVVAGADIVLNYPVFNSVDWTLSATHNVMSLFGM